jgi:hypothetical protein
MQPIINSSYSQFMIILQQILRYLFSTIERGEKIKNLRFKIDLCLQRNSDFSWKSKFTQRR